MYGMGGSFGGMPYVSRGSAIVEGIMAGQHYMQSAQDEDDRHQRMMLEEHHQAVQERMEQARLDLAQRTMTDTEQRESHRQAREDFNDEETRIRNLTGAIIQKYNGDAKAAQASPEWNDADLQNRITAHNRAGAALADMVGGPLVKQGNDRAQETAQGMAQQQPEFDPSDPNNCYNLHHMVSAASKCDPNIFLRGPNGEQSPFEQAQAQITQGFTSKDAQQLYTGMSTIFGNQFTQGRIGQLDPLGGKITGVSLNKDKPFVPTPDGQGVFPVMTLSGRTQDGGFTTQPYAPPTKFGYTTPPVGSDLQSFSIEDGLNQLGAMGTMQKLLSHPTVQENLRMACQNPDQQAQDFAHAHTITGGTPSQGGRLSKGKDGSWTYMPYTDQGLGQPVTVVPSNDKRTPALPDIMMTYGALGGKPGEGMPQWQQEADAMIGTTNPQTGKPFQTRGEVLNAEKFWKDHPDHTAAAEREAQIQRGLREGWLTQDDANDARRMGLNLEAKAGPPNAPVMKQMADLEDQISELSSGQYRDPVMGTVGIFQYDKDGNAVLDKDGRPVVDPNKQKMVENQLQGKRRQLAVLQSGYDAFGRPRRHPQEGAPTALQGDVHVVPSQGKVAAGPRKKPLTSFDPTGNAGSPTTAAAPAPTSAEP